MCRRKKRVQKEWNESRESLLHKGANKSKSEIKNYRPIALTNTAGKVFHAVLNDRLYEWTECPRVLGEEENGCHKNRRAEDNIFIVNKLTEMSKNDRNKLYLGFLDIKKAFNRMNREMP